MASRPNSHPIHPASSNLSHQKGKRTSSSSSTANCPPAAPSSSPTSSTARNPIPPASNLSRHKAKQTSSSSSTATCPPAGRLPLPSSSPAKHPICSTSKLSCRKVKRTSSSTATGPLVAPPSSSSADHPEIKYDVFLSFRGTDTRSGFLSHLLNELSRQKIEYFVDDQKLKKGDEISSTLVSAIKKSQISVVVFSKDYADSKWCLEELEQIIQCRENQSQIVVPIFYEVDPSTVRHQKGSYKKSFDKLCKRFGKDRLQNWQIALKKAANLSGFDSSKYRSEATLIREVAEHVLTELNQIVNHSDLEGFVGIHKHIQYLETLLCTESQDIFTIGIWGIGGIGKTTIAEILYNRLYNKYEGRHLLRVREELEKGRSKSDLKKDLLSKLLGEVVHDVTLNGNPTYVERRLRRQKVLVVLDDINDLDQVEILIGGHGRFGPGSRIIMTSRDKHVFSKECDEIYLVEPLNSEEALLLFDNALTKDSLVKKEERHKLSEKVVKYVQGVPLAIKILARYLRDKNKDEWKSKLEKLEKMPDSNIQNVLELSYNGLDDYEHKEIFLYLACFFKNETEEQITMLLDACGYHTIDGLRALKDKALVTYYGVFVHMHDLIRTMGCEIVRKKSLKDLGQRTHLWDSADIYEVFKKQMGTKAIESIRLSGWRLKEDLQLGSQAFNGMNNLRLLQFDEGRRVYPPDEGFESLPDELRCFNWIGYPSKSFPLGLWTENLVELNFYGSKLQALWDGVQDLPSLKILNLYGSHELIELPDLRKAPNLRYVNLLGCLELSHVPLWPNVEQDSKGCEEPKTISVGRSQISLTSHGTEESEEDGQLDLCGTSLPIKSCFNYHVFPFLEELLISGCHKLTELPDIIHLCLPSLRVLELTGTMVETLPGNIKHLSQLTKLRLSYCPRLRYIPELPPSIKYFTANECELLETLQFTSNSMHLFLLPIVFVIELRNCVKLDDPVLEAIARHYKLTAQKIISAHIEGCQTELYIPGSKLPECFSNCGTTQVSASIPFELPLCCRAMGFIFYFVISPNVDDFFGFRIKCHIELRDVAKVQFLHNCHPKVDLLESADHTLLWYESSLSFKIMEQVSKIKTSASTDDQYAVVWFELADMTSYWCGVKECRVYPVFIPSKSPQRFQNIDDNGDNDGGDDDV